MTDLELAKWACSGDPYMALILQVRSIISQARREGAETMRERAAARLRQAGRDCESRWPGVTIDEDIGDFAADIVSALPLTPEEPT